MPLMNKPPKELWKDEFKEWLESPMVRMALKNLVPEDRRDDLVSVLEAAFENAFIHGVTGTLGGIVGAMRSEKEEKKVNGIMAPGVGHA